MYSGKKARRGSCLVLPWWLRARFEVIITLLFSLSWTAKIMEIRKFNLHISTRFKLNIHSPFQSLWRAITKFKERSVSSSLMQRIKVEDQWCWMYVTASLKAAATAAAINARWRELSNKWLCFWLTLYVQLFAALSSRYTSQLSSVRR